MSRFYLPNAFERIVAFNEFLINKVIIENNTKAESNWCFLLKRSLNIKDNLSSRIILQITLRNLEQPRNQAAWNKWSKDPLISGTKEEQEMLSSLWWKSKCQLLSSVWLFVTPWTTACQAPLSMEFSRQEHWSGLPFPSPGDPLYPGMEPGSPALQVIFTMWAIREAPSSLPSWQQRSTTIHTQMEGFTSPSRESNWICKCLRETASGPLPLWLANTVYFHHSMEESDVDYIRQFWASRT